MDSPYNSVCSQCIDQEDLTSFIEGHEGPRGCWFCGLEDAPTIPLEELADHMRECLSNFYSRAIDHLPYESREGGYQGTTWETHELITDYGEVEFPRDEDDKLLFDLSNEVLDDLWCEYDWLSLDYDELLLLDWKEFCRLIQHRRRFFFQQNDFEEPDGRGFSPMNTLREFSRLSRELGLYRNISQGNVFFRARVFPSGGEEWSAKALGPPPSELATQSNRMSPPGIPMMYVSEMEQTAILEVGATEAAVGRFKLERDVLLLDLADVPEVPGIFSGQDRQKTLELAFLNSFTREIGKPIERDDRVHVDYIPSQVVTEFIRDSRIDGRQVDGIRYSSNSDDFGINVVLFATQENIMEKDGTRVLQETLFPEECWIRLIGTRMASI